MERNFKKYSDQELIDLFNKNVWNSWWNSARANFSCELRKEFTRRWFDYSKISDGTSMSYKNKIKLEDKIIRIQLL